MESDQPSGIVDMIEGKEIFTDLRETIYVKGMEYSDYSDYNYKMCDFNKSDNNKLTKQS